MFLITGATGLTGSAVVRRFAQQGEPVRALVREPKKQQFAGVAGVDTVVGDLLEPATLEPALAGIDTVVLISGADDTLIEAQCNLIDAAEEAGVGHIVKVSGLGCDHDSPFRFGRYHAQIEDYLRASSVAWTILRPSQFMQVYYREVPTLLEDGSFAVAMGDARLAPIDVEDIAAVAYAVAQSEEHHGKSFAMTGPDALRMSEVCDILSPAVGKPLHYLDIDPRIKRQQLIDNGIPPRLADDMDDLFRLRREGGPESEVHLEVFDLLQIRPTSFAEFVQRSVDIFRGTTTPAQLWASGWQRV
ncbi:SDR family oxidoreductase [Nocardia sp. BSTN01]|uniref:SDR family oxidoreductase n=1 Tax=Nocardia sp. BSTN01 TaxID=2783665 RepID=UPI00188EC65D|nr:SDR family oxidoreductase [Nocardia sp. BSTN01]MBF5000386.1 SDR family oxidoreductase [Nocardia sp. BSTN01]